MPTTQQRPLSPHLQIYKPQLTSILSILHRLTGIGLTLAAFGLVYWLWALAMGPEHYQVALRLFQSPFGKILLFSATFAFYYHLTNGIRHLVWDLGYGYDLLTIYRSGWSVITISILLTLYTWL